MATRHLLNRARIGVFRGLSGSDDTDVELIAVADRLVLLAGNAEFYGRIADLAQAI